MEPISKKVKELEEICEYTFESLQKVYLLLNSYAKNEHMKNWSCTDPEAIIGQIYSDLAPAFLKLKKVLNKNK